MEYNNDIHVKIGSINVAESDQEEKRMNIFYNGPGNDMTAENDDEIEYLEATVGSYDEAVDTAYEMYNCWPWDYEQEEITEDKEAKIKIADEVSDIRKFASTRSWKLSGWGACSGTSYNDVANCYKFIFGEEFSDACPEEDFHKYVQEGWVTFHGSLAAFWEDSI